MLIDTHCHFDFVQFAPSIQHIERARQVGVNQIIIPTLGEQNWHQVIDLAQKHAGVYFGLGIHPVFMPTNPAEALEHLEYQLAHHHVKCVAVGECGLDFVAADNETMRETQQWVLERQFRLANQFGLPVMLHCRKSFNELLRVLKQTPVEKHGVYHAFSGSYQQACQLVDMGYKLGIGGVITYERAKKTREAVKRLPLEALVLETDAPDMPLSGYQGQANHPDKLPIIVAALAQLKGLNEQKVVEECRQVSLELFAMQL